MTTTMHEKFEMLLETEGDHECEGLGRDKVCEHRLARGDELAWIARHSHAGYRIVAVELAHNATPLGLLRAASSPTIALVGHESVGIPQGALELVDEVVEIPMRGLSNCLNVSVAGSLVLYRLAGLS